MADKIRPVKGKKNVLITSALPYVNNVPHLGNLIGSVLSADVFARYSRRRGNNTLFICGTDEYGTATETKALEEGITPKQLVDKFHKVHKDIYDWFNLSFDYFGRTTSDKHTEIVQDMFLKIWNNGGFEERTTTQPFCEKHNAFLADRYVEGICPKCGYEDARGDQCDACGNLLDPFELIKPRCKVCSKAGDAPAPVPRDTKHIFLNLPPLQEKVQAWFEKSSKTGKWSPNGASITRTWLDKGLEPRSITRDLKWGIPIPLPDHPEYNGKVIYVWFDACIGYPSITACYDPEGWEQWWKDPENVKLYQFLGKDNQPFHSITFPACQIASGEDWTMVHHISATEYLNYENTKFSKSRSIGVFGDQAKETKIPADVWRFALVNSRPESGDTQFEWGSFVTLNNSVLLNNLGNFINRIIKFVNAKFDGVVPEYSPDHVDETPPEDHALDTNQWKDAVNKLLTEYIAEGDAVHLRAALVKALSISAAGNDLLQGKLDNAHLENEPERTKTVIGLALNHCALVASIISAFMPATADSIAKQLNIDLPIIPETFTVDFVKAGHKIGKAAYLFSRIDEKKVEEWKEKFGGTSEEKAAAAAAKKKKQEEKERKKAKKAAEKAAAAQAADGKTENKAASSEPHTAATEERQELPVREKPVEK